MTAIDEAEATATYESSALSSKFRELMDIATAAGKNLQSMYDELAARGESTIADARRVADEFADNIESALRARQDAAREGLGGRIRR